MGEATEAHFELYHLLRSVGVNVTAEERIGRLRADIAIWENGHIVLLIECKGVRGATEETRQRIKYRATGIPFLYCYGMRAVNETVDRVLRRLDKGCTLQDP